MQSMQNNNATSYFLVGILYHEGKYIEQDIEKAIYFYKSASSANISYAKNNLGIIYKNGFYEEIPKDIAYAIVLFEESIRLKNDPVSMYNLAHIYLYNETIKNSIDKSIQLFLKSAKQNFAPSINLLCIALIKKYGNNIDEINNELSNYYYEYGEIIGQIMSDIKNFLVYELYDFELTYENYKNIDFFYNFYFQSFRSNEVLNQKEKKKREEENQKNNKYNIDSHFYEGLGDI